MSDENMVMVAFALLMLSAVLTPLFFRWRKSKGQASIYAADQSLEDVGLSTVMNIGAGKVEAGLDGRLVLRPPFGARVLGPLFAAIMLYTVDLTPIYQPFGLDSPARSVWANGALWALLAYAVFMLNVRQRITVDGHMLTCQGVQLRPQTRDLTGLVDIALHPKRPALVLRFTDQPRLYLPKHLTGRDTFVPLMEEIAAGNRAAGMAGQPEGMMARAGF